ncbi:hypothetical protein MKEN_01163000 [Mycena kentingensis (nom. inval.)]|nr:hypothetical protein MKEN_01163000 [Mycena kentingensis (nom. inval.)]
MAVSTSRVPAEIWREIIHQVSDDDMGSVFATSHAFSTVARPLLFSKITIEAYGLDAQPDEAFLPGPEERRWVRARVDFYASAQIAPLVLECKLVTWQAVDKEDYVFTSNIFYMLDYVFARMRAWTNLRTLTTVGDLPDVDRMPNLDELDINLDGTGNVDDEDFHPKGSGPPLTTLTLSNEDMHPPEDELAPWLPFLDPRWIEFLKIECNFDCWGEHPDRIPVFDCVYDLWLTFFPDSGSRQSLDGVLAHFPAVQHLQLNVAHGDTARIESLVALGAQWDPLVATVDEIYIPHELLHIFVPHAPNLTILKINTEATIEAACIALFASTRSMKLRCLAFTKVAVATTSFSPSVNAFAFIDALSHAFPELENLWVHFLHANQPTDVNTSDSETELDFFKTLVGLEAGRKPTKLRTIMFRWPVPRPNEDAGSLSPQSAITNIDANSFAPPATTLVASLDALADDVFAAYPALTLLRLTGSSFLLASTRRRAAGDDCVQKTCRDGLDARQLVAAHEEAFDIWEDILES